MVAAADEQKNHSRHSCKFFKNHERSPTTTIERRVVTTTGRSLASNLAAFGRQDNDREERGLSQLACQLHGRH
jgi:hypothetical protein